MIKDFQRRLDKIVCELIYANVNDLLNDEGVRTLEAFRRLSELAEFHSDFKEYMEDEDVKRIFKDYSDCRKVRSAKEFLDRRINE